MLFPTVTFVVFFLAVFAGGWALARRPRAWKLFMLLASYVFYLGWGWRPALLLAGSTLVNFVIGKSLGRRVRVNAGRGEPRRRSKTARSLLVLGVAVNIGLLAWFKVYGFFVSSLDTALRTLGIHAGLPFLEILAPVGISFFTFRAISYLIDIYRRKARPVPILDFGVFMAFFPYLAAGPLVRTEELLPQLRKPRLAGRIETGRALYLIVMGLAKKIVVADFLARTLVDPVFSTPGRYSGLVVAVAIYGYAVQIYCDFSGYTDMAIGIALLLGVRLPDNFASPYTSLSPRDFWRRWHMTLSRWLRDYLYISLGGSRGGSLRTYRNLILTMVLGGLWHGSGWTFVLWGAVHGLALAADHAVAKRQDRAVRRSAETAAHAPAIAANSGRGESERTPRQAPSRLNKALARLATFHFVCLAWVLFRADSLTTAGRMFKALFGPWTGSAALVTGWAILAIVAGIGLQYLPSGVAGKLQGWVGRLRPVPQALLLALCLFAIIAVGPRGVASFIYFQF